MRLRLAVVFVVALGSTVAVGQQAPPCTKELVGVLFDFGTADAPRLFKCDGRTWSAWTPPASLCAAAPVATAEAPTPPPPPPLPSTASTELPPLPTAPTPGTDVVANTACRKSCTSSYHVCVRTRCAMSVVATCKQECDRQQTRCVTGCP